MCLKDILHNTSRIKPDTPICFICTLSPSSQGLVFIHGINMTQTQYSKLCWVRTPRFRPRPLRALAAWGSSPSKLQQSKLPLLTPPTSPRGLLAGEGAGGAAGTSCVPHPRQEGRAPGRFPRTAPGLPGWSVRTGSHGLSPALSGYLAPTSARWGGREPARPAAYPGWQRGVWGCCR